MMSYQTVPLPLTAAEKLGEASHFFNQMIALTHKPREFAYNLSAFLAALRSITDNYLPKQYSRNPDFERWFDNQRIQLENDPIMKALIQLRNETVHLNPIREIYYEAGPALPTGGICTDHFEWTHALDETGTIVCTCRVGKEGQEMAVTPVVKWIFRIPEEREVLLTCRYGLERMQQLLEEWQTVLNQNVARAAQSPAQ